LWNSFGVKKWKTLTEKSENAQGVVLGRGGEKADLVSVIESEMRNLGREEEKFRGKA